jgi:plastocyanin
MNVIRTLLIAGLAVILGAAAISNSPVRAEQPVAYEIAIKDFEFSPRTLTVRVGSKVTWTNKDEEPHKVVEVDNAFTSQPLDTDNNFTFEFDTPGTYQYFCSLHPHMTGKIVVEK